MQNVLMNFKSMSSVFKVSKLVLGHPMMIGVHFVFIATPIIFVANRVTLQIAMIPLNGTRFDVLDHCVLLLFSSNEIKQLSLFILMDFDLLPFYHLEIVHWKAWCFLQVTSFRTSRYTATCHPYDLQTKGLTLHKQFCFNAFFRTAPIRNRF